MIRQIKITPMITTRDSQSIEKYLQVIKEIPRIDPDEEVRLARLIRIGDQDAYEQLVNANLRFVVSVAKKYQNMGLTLSDLINEGNLGLCKAARRFDETRGFKFISYAVWWIRQTIMAALNGHAKMVALPMNVVNAIRKVKDTSGTLFAINGYEPTPEELAEALDMSVTEVNDIIRSGQDLHFSLDAPIGGSDEDVTTWLDMLESTLAPTDYAADRSSNSELIVSTVRKVLRNNREYMVIAAYYGIDGYEQMTLEQIGRRLGLTSGRTRQIYERAKQRIYSSKRMQNLQYA